MPKTQAIVQAIVYIKSNWQQGKTLQEIADLYGLDAGNLERAFRNREEMTAKQFVDQKRKQHVVYRLSQRDVYGYEIGSELGFPNDLAFYRWVKRSFGVSFAGLRSGAHRQTSDKK